MFAYHFPVDGLDDFRLCSLFLTDQSTTTTCAENIADGASRSSGTDHHDGVFDLFFFSFFSLIILSGMCSFHYSHNYYYCMLTIA